MNRFTKENNLMHLIETNYNLLPVINRFGINLGNRDKTLSQICKSLNVNIDFFLAIVNTYHNVDYFPEQELKGFSPLVIIEYLKKTHSYYINYTLPKLDTLLKQLIESNKTEIQQLNIIEKFYRKNTTELLLHLKEEEEVVFPYVYRLIKNRSRDSNYNIRSFEKEHSHVDVQLNDLKNLIIKYTEPVYDNNICNEFLRTLFRFEKDINDHARIEDKILIPQVIVIENTLNG